MCDSAYSTRYEEIAQGLFFITGTGRCGTTLLQAMLSSHSEIDVPHETRFFGQADPESRGFHNPLRDDELEPYIEDRLNDWWWQALGLATDSFAMELRSRLRSSRSIFLWMLQSLTLKANKRRVGEKTPYYGTWAEHLQRLFPHAQFIHLHRDPRDVIVSFRSQEWWVTKNVLSCAMLCRDFLAGQRRLAELWDKSL